MQPFLTLPTDHSCRALMGNRPLFTPRTPLAAELRNRAGESQIMLHVGPLVLCWPIFQPGVCLQAFQITCTTAWVGGLGPQGAGVAAWGWVSGAARARQIGVGHFQGRFWCSPPMPFLPLPCPTPASLDIGRQFAAAGLPGFMFWPRLRNVFDVAVHLMNL